jgi:prephenate dehydrogenase
MTRPTTGVPADSATGARTGAQPREPSLRSVLVAGTGLMGTSVALALRARGVEVSLLDRDPSAARLAADLGAGVVADSHAELAVIAVPPSAVASVLQQLQKRDAADSYTDLSSTKGMPQRQIEAVGCRTETFVGGHPLAGRERSGPGAARADLFQGRPWVLTPSPATDPLALQQALQLVRLCDATPVIMDPDEHDHAVALVSHAPHVMASLVAARLVTASDEAVRLAGQGLRDVTRIAASDPMMWQEILATNAAAVADELDAIALDLAGVIRALRQAAATGAVATDTAAEGVGADAEGAGDIHDTAFAPVLDVLRRGKAGRARIPGKHGQPPAAYSVVRVVVADRPGELARLFTDAGSAGINVEDVAIEHSPGQPVGLVELSVRPAVAPALTAALRERGWSVHG